jgi:VCBS repeat-containing protein
MTLSKITLATTAAAVMALTATPVSAQVAEQSQGQSQNVNASTNVNLNCNSTGSYGQFSCTASGSSNANGSQSQNQSQRIDLGASSVRYVYRADGTRVAVHVPANTALDTKAMLAAIGTMMTGAAGLVTKIKNRA